MCQLGYLRSRGSPDFIICMIMCNITFFNKFGQVKFIGVTDVKSKLHIQKNKNTTRDMIIRAISIGFFHAFMLFHLLLYLPIAPFSSMLPPQFDRQTYDKPDLCPLIILLVYL